MDGPPEAIAAGADMVAGLPTEKFQPVLVQGLAQPATQQASSDPTSKARTLDIRFLLELGFVASPWRQNRYRRPEGRNCKVFEIQHLGRRSPYVSTNMRVSTQPPILRCLMTPLEAAWLINIGLVVVGALLRGHAPRLWPFVAPIFGGTNPPGPPPSAPPDPTGASVPKPPPLPPSLLARLSSIPEPTEDDELEDILRRYVGRQQQGRRLGMLLRQAQQESARRDTATKPPEPSAN